MWGNCKYGYILIRKWEPISRHCR